MRSARGGNGSPGPPAFGIHKALRQALHYAVRATLLDESPAALVANPEPKRGEVPTFTLDEPAAAAAELVPAFRAIPVFAALTGLRPCEWIGLERRDVNQPAGVVTVRRGWVDGKVKPYGKTSRSLRAVPLPLRAAEALSEHPARLRFPPALPGGPWRPPVAADVAVARVVPGAPRGRNRQARPVRAQAHLRESVDRRACLSVRVVAVHGDFAADDRPNLRAPAGRRTQPVPDGARRVPRQSVRNAESTSRG